ncbi:MAG: hypothetical protein HQ483_01040 [Rhodospirillales bacterium]|nr:hypothetical protein [Rhodospirillales bacterium]
MKLSKYLLTAAAVTMIGFGAISASAGEYDEQVKAAYAKHVAPWLSDPAVISAIKAQNEKHASMDAAAIDVADKAWRAEKKAGGGAMVDAVLGNALSAFLKDKKAASGGLITEMFIMDNKGMNVGQSDVTSDYMQGDEAKWQKTYSVGDGAMFIDEVEFDDSTKSFQVQVNGTVSDGGTPVGAITVGMNVEKL